MSLRFGIVPAHGPAHLAEAIEHVRLAREYGLDAIWIEEHHDAGAYWPTPLLAIAALAPHLGPLSIGTAILILPLHDPVHVAEQGAILDQMTGGKLTFGFGLGDDEAEFALFRVPAKQRGGRALEQIAIIRELWQGKPVTFDGRFYQLDNALLRTLPLQPGGPPIWIGGWGPRQLERAATIGDAWLPGPVGTFSDIRDRQSVYDEHVRTAGGDPFTRPRPLIRDVVVAGSDAAAWELASRCVLAAYRATYVESDHVLVGHETSGGTIMDDRALAADRLIVGSPDTVAEQLAACISRLRATELVIRLKLPGLDPGQMTEMLHLLGRSVLPELRKTATGEAT